MSKIILEFDAQEDQIEASCAINGTKWMSLVFDIDQELRMITKYGNSLIGENEASDTELQIAEILRDMIRDSMIHSGLTFL